MKPKAGSSGKNFNTKTQFTKKMEEGTPLQSLLTLKAQEGNIMRTFMPINLTTCILWENFLKGINFQN